VEYYPFHGEPVQQQYTIRAKYTEKEKKCLNNK
jgi:hypothetical protein